MPQHRARKQERQNGVFQDMRNPAEVKDEGLPEELGPPQPAVQPVGDAAVGIRVAGENENDRCPKENRQPAGEDTSEVFRFQSCNWSKS